MSKKTLYDHAWDLLCCLEAKRGDPGESQRPIVFIVHSLGGIAVKEALRRARGCKPSKPHLHNIFEATASIIFFGTPHGGADPRSSLHHILAASAQALGVQVNKQIVDTLMPKSERLTELRDEFPAMCQERNWLIYSFQEEYGVTALFGTRVVEDWSSCLNNPVLETRQFISSNHMDMCRFSGLQDPEYAKVAAAMKRIVGTIEKKPQDISRAAGEDCISRELSVVEAAAMKRVVENIETRFQDISRTAGQDRISHELSVVEGQDSPQPQEARDQRGKALVSIAEETKTSLIEQLYFAKIDERLTSLTAAQAKTCSWFLTKPEYISWRDPAEHPKHGGFLWIRGHPGTGKSTLMKFLFENAKSKTKAVPSQIMLSFFFLARGDLEEKSTTGLYRSLLHQLFQKAPDLQDSMEWMTVDGARGIQANGWHEEALKQTFLHAIPRLGSRELTIFVDALDECEDSQARDMVFFFEQLCDEAQEKKIRLSMCYLLRRKGTVTDMPTCPDICFSSRHYPHIEIKKGILLTLEDEPGHKEDIQHYIKAKLRLKNTKAAQSFQAEILEKSSLIFLWVVLVVGILNDEYPGKTIDKMRQRLKEIPPTLAHLFEMILTRDKKHPRLLQICLQCVLFAARPLKPQELYFAVQFGLGEECDAGRWDQETLSLDEMKNFARHASKGLAGVTRNKASEVQFIHESVRDFLLGRYGMGQWSEAADGDFVGQSYEVLRDCCLAQLKADIKITPDPQLQASPETAQSPSREALGVRFPFLEYSVIHVLHHANNAQQHGIAQRAFLDRFPLQQWATLNDGLEKHAIRRYGESANLRYILAEKNLAHLIAIHPRAGSCFDVVPEARYGPPIFAALATGSDGAVRALLEAELQAQPVESQSRLRELCEVFFENREKFTTLGFDFKFSKQRGVFSHLAECSHDALLAILPLVSSCHDLAYQGRTALSYAAGRGHTDTVNFLQEMGFEIESRDKYGQTPLSWAARNGHESMVRILLEKGAEIESRDKDGQTPFYWAAREGRESTVKILLEKGAEIESRDEYGHAPLSWAARNGHEPIVRILLEKGAEIESGDDNGRTPLSWAARNGHESIVKLLLEEGAESESRDIPYSQTPLSWAAENGHESTAKILLEKGAEIESRDDGGRTPLSWAAGRGHESTVKILLEKGAEIESRDGKGRTPLWWATSNKRTAIVDILLEQGARAESSA